MKWIIILLFLNLILEIHLNDVCTYYENEYSCQDGTYKISMENYEDRCFQTPYRGGTHDPVYRESYQDMHYLVGYAKLRYTEDKETCTITFFYKVNQKKVKLGNDHEILFYFGGNEQKSDTFTVTKENDTYPNGLSLSARIVNKGTNDTFAQLELEEEYFVWNVPKYHFDNETLREKGQKGAIVELFGWPYEDIIEESDFLNLAGYLGVKISPPNEYVLTDNWIEANGLNPWENYLQTVSYKLKSRLGDKKDLKNLIYVCRKKGIRIYAQLAINQMTFEGNDIYKEHSNDCNVNANWPGKNATAGSPFFTVYGRRYKNFYTGEAPIFEYPSVPYCGTDIFCKSDAASNYFSGWVKNGMLDVNTHDDYVRQRIADFLTELMSLGITGFSIHNGKYIPTVDYVEIFSRLKNNLGGGKFPMIL